jgi:hypothetical protein
MEIGTRLSVVSSQGEADIICGLLRTNGIRCGERALNPNVYDFGVGGWRELLVGPSDLEAARDVLAAVPRPD